MTKKPDRFKRMVEEAALINGEDRFLDASTIVKLLCREHRWMIRMIKTMKAPPWEVADVLSRRGILDKLAQRAK